MYPCIVCSKSIQKQNKRCRACYIEYVNIPSNTSQFKNGLTSRKRINFCQCGQKITNYSKSCMTCWGETHRGVNGTRYTTGTTLEKKVCIDCNKQLSRGAKLRCVSCNNINQTKQYDKLCPCGKKLGTNAKYKENPKCRSCSQKLKVVSQETKDKISKSHKGKKLSSEHRRNCLRRRKISYFEQKIIDLIKENNLNYRFVGNGEVWIENRNPDFININGKKEIIEVYGKKFKLMHYNTIEEYEKDRTDLYNKYDFNVIFLNDSHLNNKNWKTVCLEKINGK